MPITAATLAASAALKHEDMLASLATGRRRCPRCCDPGETLPLEAFGRSRSAPSGYHGLCRSCKNADQRDREASRRREAAAGREHPGLARAAQIRAEAERLRREDEADRARAEALALWRRGRGPHPDLDFRARLSEVQAARPPLPNPRDSAGRRDSAVTGSYWGELERLTRTATTPDRWSADGRVMRASASALSPGETRANVT